MTPPSQPTLPLAEQAPRPPAAEPTHPCIRCGRPGVGVDAALCEECNPLELAQPSATQVHGIAALGIIAFVVVLAVLGLALVARDQAHAEALPPPVDAGEHQVRRLRK